MRKLTELIEELQFIADQLEQDGIEPSEVVVLVGQQPSYPLTAEIVNVVSGENVAQEAGDSGQEIDGNFKDAVWIATSEVGSYSDFRPYAPKAVWSAS